MIHKEPAHTLTECETDLSQLRGAVDVKVATSSLR